MSQRTWPGRRAITATGLTAVFALTLACEQEPSTAPLDADSAPNLPTEQTDRRHYRLR